LLGSALVQGLALARLLGRVRPARDQTALRARHPRDLVVRSRQGRDDPSVSHASKGGGGPAITLFPWSRQRPSRTEGAMFTRHWCCAQKLSVTLGASFHSRFSCTWVARLCTSTAHWSLFET